MKKEPLDHEREQDRWLGATLRQTSVSPTDRCLDAETLAAWTDGALSADAAAAVETHLSDCAHCIAMAAAMERTAPAATARHAWTPGRVFRWLVPLTAAATAVALWVAVPDGPVTPVQSPPAEERQATSERADSSPREQVPVPVPVPVPEGTTSAQKAVPELRAENQNLAREPSTLNQTPAPSTQNPEPPAELTARDALAKSSPPPPAAELSAPAAPQAAAKAQGAVDSLAGTAVSTARRAEGLAFGTRMLEAVVPANPQFRWRVVGATSIERSTDGGKTWMKTIPLPRDRVEGLTIVGIRARSDLQAIAQMSNDSEFYTSDGGKAWTQLQEKSAAPF